MLDKAKKELKMLNYEVKNEDEDKLKEIIEKHSSQIMYICGLEEICRPLEYVIVDRVCAEFLKSKIAIGENIGISVGNAKSVQIGDVTVDFPDNSSSQEKLELILDNLERKDFDYSPYAKMRW